MKGETIIIAPHADDEIIGCYEVLRKAEKVRVLYGSEKAYHEGVHAWRMQDIECGKVENNMLLLNPEKTNTYYFPDPYFETHPLHRELGALGEKLARKGFDVVFYCTNMQAPYIQEVKNPVAKKNFLENSYHLKRSLWQYDHKYFLFEGYTKWIIK